MSHRARVVVAVDQQHLTARRPPPGHYPIDARWPLVVIAGSSLHCGGCGTSGETPSPRAAGYGAAVQAFLREHRRCGAAA